MRQLRRRLENRELLEQSERIARETGLTTGEVEGFRSKLPADPRSLRGIPVQGRGIGGAIRDTRPGDGLE